MPKIKVKDQTVQTGERPQTNGQTHGRYQTYYRPCYAVDKKRYSLDGATFINKWTLQQDVAPLHETPAS